MEWTASKLINTLRNGQSQLADVMRERAISYLAGHCDGAYKLDGAGFNRMDAAFGHSLADRISTSYRKPGQKLSIPQQKAAGKMLAKYAGTQLLPVVNMLTSVDGAGDVREQAKDLAHQYADLMIAGQYEESGRVLRQLSDLGKANDLSGYVEELLSGASSYIAMSQESKAERKNEEYLAHGRQTPTDAGEMQRIAEYEEELAGLPTF